MCAIAMSFLCEFADVRGHELKTLGLINVRQINRA